MGRRAVAFTQDSVARAIRAVKKAGIDVRTVRVEPDGSVVINGDNAEISAETVDAAKDGYL